MLQASIHIPRGRGLATTLMQHAAQLELDWDIRQKPRFDAMSSDGRHLDVFLAFGTGLRGGDFLVAQEGSHFRVVAAPQPVLRVTARPDLPEYKKTFDLMRGAYHLCICHVPIELRHDHLKIEPDPFLEEMLRAMHLQVVAALEPFEPGAHTGDEHGSMTGQFRLQATNIPATSAAHPGLTFDACNRQYVEERNVAKIRTQLFIPAVGNRCAETGRPVKAQVSAVCILPSAPLKASTRVDQISGFSETSRRLSAL